MKITRRQLKQIIREAIEVMDDETGEIMTFQDKSSSYGNDYGPVAPEAAWPSLVKRLGLTPEIEETDPNGTQMITLSSADMTKLRDEIYGKQRQRQHKKNKAEWEAEDARLNVDNLITRAREWAKDLAYDWQSDRSSGNLEGYPDLADAAYDLARNARYEFADDEWDELVEYFEDEDSLYDFIANSMI